MADRKHTGKPDGTARRTGRDGSTSRGASSAAKRALRRERAWVEPRLVLGRTSYLLLAGGAVSVIAGFLLLAARDITLAPILLVLGYCFLVPAGLLWRGLPGLSDRAGRNAAGE